MSAPRTNFQKQINELSEHATLATINLNFESLIADIKLFDEEYDNHSENQQITDFLTSIIQLTKSTITNPYASREILEDDIALLKEITNAATNELSKKSTISEQTIKEFVDRTKKQAEAHMEHSASNYKWLSVSTGLSTVFSSLAAMALLATIVSPLVAFPPALCVVALAGFLILAARSYVIREDVARRSQAHNAEAATQTKIIGYLGLFKAATTAPQQPQQSQHLLQN